MALDVTIIDVDAKGLKAAQSELAGEGLTVAIEEADVTDKDCHPRRRLTALWPANGRLDVMFVNAGITGGPGYHEARRRAQSPLRRSRHQSNELWEKVLAINLMGAVKTIQAAVPHMKKAGRRVAL
jgi:NAD(P)-dependent dehydrogenase (short-subunit alcohol dehydrogenase family)